MVQIHHTDQGLAPGSKYEYQVFAVRAGLESIEGSNKVSDFTLFAALDVDQENWQNDCMVQRINAGSLFNSGAKVRITLRGSTNNPLTIKSASISQAAPPGGSAGEPWDSLAGDVKPVTFPLPLPGGNVGVNLAAGKPVTSELIDYNLDQTKDLILAFDIGTQGGARRGPKVGCQAYRRAGTQQAPAEQAATADRSNFTVQGPPSNPTEGQPPNTVYLVEKIEVLP